MTNCGCEVQPRASLVTDDMTGSESDFITEGQLLRGEITVALNDANGQLTADELARFRDGLQTMNVAFADYGVTLVEADPTETDYAHVQISVDTTSACGGLAEGVLGLYETSGLITLIDGWDWYTGADPAQIGDRATRFPDRRDPRAGPRAWLGA